MLSKWLAAAALTLALGASSMAVAGVPTEKIRDTSNQVIAIIMDKNLKAPDKEPERRAKIRAIVDQRFDWTEMAKRSLGRYWLQRTPEEQKQFTKLFSDLIERTYSDSVESYKGQPFSYLSETNDGGYAVVKVSVPGENGHAVIPLEYRLLNRDNDWFVYDVTIEGVSLVNNYRTQFSDILSSSSYEKLVKRIEAKLQEKKTD